MSQYGNIEFAGKDIALPAVTYDRMAVGERNHLYLVSIVAETQRVKAIRAILCGGARATIQASGGRVVRSTPRSAWDTGRNPGVLSATEAGYNAYVHKLDYGQAHALFITRTPGFLKVVSPAMLWRELNEVRFTTPLIPAWLPYVEEQLREKELLEDAECFNVKCGVLNATTPDLDSIVEEGLKSGNITIPRSINLTTLTPTERHVPGPTGPVPEPEAPKSWKVGVFTRGDREPTYNGCRYKTAADAERAAQDLFSRWTAMEKWQIDQSDDPPNR